MSKVFRLDPRWLDPRCLDPRCLDPRWPLCLLAAVFAVLMLRASLTPLYDPDSASYIA
jgi:hypothetical protein